MQQTLKAVIHAVLAFFGLKAIIMLNGIVEDLAQRTVALDAERRFATKLFSHLHTLSLSYHLEKHIGEITPGYLSDGNKSARRILKVLPNVKLIAILRNPVDRAFSNYVWAVRDRAEKLTNFKDALAAEENRIHEN